MPLHSDDGENDEEEERQYLSSQEFKFLLSSPALEDHYQSAYGAIRMFFNEDYYAVVRADKSYTFMRNNMVMQNVSPDEFIKMLDKTLK